MDLLEYQAKELFQAKGIPVLPAQRIDHPKDLKALTIPYPVVLKSQVRRGGRGRAGGIKFVCNTIDAIAAAQAIFHLPIMGEYPEVLLAEAKYDTDQELYLAITLDSSARRPVLLGSVQGGMGVETALDKMQQVVVAKEFSPFYARRLTIQMGLKGKLVQTVSGVLEKMYQLFLEKDLDCIEINPLGISPSGEVMALDGKVTVNDAAICRHADLLAWATRYRSHQPRFLVPMSPESVATSLVLTPTDGGTGNIGVLCNGAALTMAVLDQLHRLGGKPAALLNIGGECHEAWLPDTLIQRVVAGLESLSRNKNVKVIVVNILSGLVDVSFTLQAIVDWLTKYSDQPTLPALVLRLVGDQASQKRACFTYTGDHIVWAKDLDDSVQKAIDLSRNPSKTYPLIKKTASL